ncbi:uncharacterized protein JN550_013328 [Neoarthrinium moseri]|uniref:uncharacterized protein n=1 Tax=Neoarthrinium moseri TaxID=1658444 RepID=UPI001FDD0DCE|nr:uncharacterized protein JN550_013328 [Neoarthrinium moseri]KAI1857302.1 hypothetical protein JN550_013328 [Neoarthrinium moseri]
MLHCPVDAKPTPTIGADNGGASSSTSTIPSSYSLTLAPDLVLMSGHESQAWSEPSGSGYSEASDSASDGEDHDMTDAEDEDGGAPLTAVHVDGDGTAPPLVANAMESASHTLSPGGQPFEDDAMFLEVEHEMPLSDTDTWNPTVGSPSTAPTPTLAVVPVPMPVPQVHPHIQIPAVAHPFAQLPAFAQQALLNGGPQHAQFQQLLTAVNDDLEDEFAEMHPMPQSNPNPMSLGPDNLDLVQFLRMWARMERLQQPRQAKPRIDRVSELTKKPTADRISYDQLNGDQNDLQGIDWEDLGVTRKQARERRRATYNNYVNKDGSDKWHPALPDRLAVPRENYFRFNSMNMRRDASLLHFQLRNILGCTSRTRAFFPSPGCIREIDPTTGRTKKAMKFEADSDVTVSTLATSNDVLVVGGFMGDYHFRNVNSEDRSFTQGKLTDNVSGITNHVQIHSSRLSSTPIAAFASNDFGFRTVDLNTNHVLSETMFKFALNCSAISADHRLRVMVGDYTNVLITDAESGETLQDLSGHRDFGFACAWAPDGWTVATGFQDKSVRIWDARKWRSSHTGQGCPVAVLRMDMSGARSLRFSPLGSGKRLLIAAEEADTIHAIDAQTFDTEQKLELFGEIGGTAFADEGRSLMALVCDPARGGLIQFDRCDAGAEDMFNVTGQNQSSQHWNWWRSNEYDWASNSEIVAQPDYLGTVNGRRRRAAIVDNPHMF